MSIATFNALVFVWIALGGGVFISLFFISAPYGRYRRSGWGPNMASRWGWFLMEAPSAIVMAVAFFAGGAPRNLPAWLFLAMWEAHYIHRAFIYPFSRRDYQKRMPVSVAAMATIFNLVNAGINGYYLFTLSGGFANSWLSDPRFIAGFPLFVLGFAANRWADRKLRMLRGPGETGYAVPTGGLYRFVSSPNYLGEIMEWLGWALATSSLAGLSFAVWTLANLAPRARANHRWYRQHFPDYPPERRALLPGIW